MEKKIKIESLRLRIGDTVLDLSVEEAKSLKRELDSFLSANEPRFVETRHPMLPDIWPDRPVRVYADCFDMDWGGEITGPVRIWNQFDDRFYAAPEPEEVPERGSDVATNDVEDANED